MKKDRTIFILSLLIHAIVLLVSVYIIIPQNDKFWGSKDFLKVDFFKLKPVEEKIILKEKKVKSEEKNTSPENKNESEKKMIIQSPDQAIISKFSADNFIVSERFSNIERKADITYSPEVKAISPAINLTKRITNTINKRESELINVIDQPTQNFAKKGNPIVQAISSVGPIGAGGTSRGQSEKYINAMSTVMPRGGVDQFAYIFPPIGERLAKRSRNGKLDIVFIIDATGSMEDNVIGVKDYIDHFLKPFEEMNVDIRLGLVEFSDIEARKEKVHNLTDNLKNFKKWLEKMKFYGGRDLPESGYEAIVTAIEKINYRKSAQKAFIFISDSPQHDFDYDGKSRYTLDRIISMLNEQNITIDVIGLDFLPMKQLAWGTGGQWKAIPGGNLALDMPVLGTQKIQSKLTASMLTLEDTVIVNFESVIPDWIEISYKVLDPKGNKVIGALTYRKDIEDKSTKKIEFPVKFGVNDFVDRPGVYTLIYRTRDSYGNQNILRQNFELLTDS
jgi:hypothetical protein